MLYSEVVNKGLILPYKSKYSKIDVDKLMVDSLFEKAPTMTVAQAKFICRCSGTYHDTNWSKYCKLSTLDNYV